MGANFSEDYHYKKNAYNASRYIPEVRVSFHTEDECYQVLGRKIKEKRGEALDPTYQLLSVNTQKNLSSPAGGFTVTLAGTQWANRLKSNDLVTIKMGYVGEALNTVMIGLIDTVTRKRTAVGGKPQLTTTVTGRDFGKILLNTKLVYYPEIGNHTDDEAKKFFLTEEGKIDALGIFAGEENDKKVTGSPAEILDKIMRYFLRPLNKTKWKVYNEASENPTSPTEVEVGQIVRYTFEDIDFFLPMILSADQFEGSIWNLMEQAIQRPFTELFIDTRDSSEAWNPSGDGRVVSSTIKESSSPSKHKPGEDGHYPAPSAKLGDVKVLLAYRFTPFDTGKWKKLVKHDVSGIDVLNEDLSISDNEHYNLFWAGMTVNPLGDINLKAVMPPLINEKDVLRYGISPLEVQLNGMDVSRETEDEDKKHLEKQAGKYSAMLKAWYEKNHKFWSGSLQVRGKANYRVGQALCYTDIDKEFYIEGVSHTFNVFHDWTTSLQVTRGQEGDFSCNHEDFVRAPEQDVQNATSEEEKTSEAVSEAYYTVKSGDTLWKIASMGDHYGDGTKWKKIWEANKAMLIERDSRNASDPGHWIYPGQKLRIPK